MGRDGFEPSKQVAADLQSVPPLATRESAHVFNYDTCIVYHNRCDYASIFFNYSEPPTHIRKTARYSCFTAATQLILLICVGVALFEPP